MFTLMSVREPRIWISEGLTQADSRFQGGGTPRSIGEFHEFQAQIFLACGRSAFGSTVRREILDGSNRHRRAGSIQSNIIHVCTYMCIYIYTHMHIHTHYINII